MEISPLIYELDSIVLEIRCLQHATTVIVTFFFSTRDHRRRKSCISWNAFEFGCEKLKSWISIETSAFRLLVPKIKYLIQQMPSSVRLACLPTCSTVVIINFLKREQRAFVDLTKLGIHSCFNCRMCSFVRSFIQFIENKLLWIFIRIWPHTPVSD